MPPAIVTHFAHQFVDKCLGGLLLAVTISVIVIIGIAKPNQPQPARTETITVQVISKSLLNTGRVYVQPVAVFELAALSPDGPYNEVFEQWQFVVVRVLLPPPSGRSTPYTYNGEYVLRQGITQVIELDDPELEQKLDAAWERVCQKQCERRDLTASMTRVWVTSGSSLR